MYTSASSQSLSGSNRKLLHEANHRKAVVGMSPPCFRTSGFEERLLSRGPDRLYPIEQISFIGIHLSKRADQGAEIASHSVGLLFLHNVAASRPRLWPAWEAIH